MAVKIERKLTSDLPTERKTQRSSALENLQNQKTALNSSVIVSRAASSDAAAVSVRTAALTAPAEKVREPEKAKTLAKKVADEIKNLEPENDDELQHELAPVSAVDHLVN